MKLYRLLSIIIFFTVLLAVNPSVNGEVVKGTAAPVFNLRTPNGELVKPFQLQKPMVISFFFTECQNCKIELKELEQFYLRNDDKITLFIVGTSFKKDVDVAEDVDAFIKELGVNVTPLVDKYKDVIRLYGVSKYPSLFFINSKGDVVFKSDVYSEKTISELEKQLKTVK